MQLHRVGYFKYDSGQSFFPVDDRFHVDIEEIGEGLVVFVVAPFFPSPNMMTVHSFKKVKRICGDGIYYRKRNEAL